MGVCLSNKNELYQDQKSGYLLSFALSMMGYTYVLLSVKMSAAQYQSSPMFFVFQMQSGWFQMISIKLLIG